MTKKEFVLQVVDQFKENPRAVLAGHGINPAVLQAVVERPDIMSKLATFLYSTNYAKKGANGLKKQSNMRIFGYKTFGEFFDKSRGDIETFVGGLSPEDSGKFKNNENIIVYIIAPQKPQPESDVVADIVAGPSVVMTFDAAIRKAAMMMGCAYMVLMFGDSAIRTAEVKAAERKAVANKKKQAVRNPGKIRSELKSKANKRLAILKKKRDDLEQLAFNTSTELEQFNNLGNELGANVPGNASSVNAAIRNANKNNAANVVAFEKALKSLDADQLDDWNTAKKLYKKGKIKQAKELAAELGPDFEMYLENEPKEGDVIEARKKAIKKQLREITTRNEDLLTLLETAPDEKKNSIRSMISRNNTQIRTLRAKLGTYADISVAGMNKKAKLLAEVHAAMEANIAAGNGIKASLEAALNKLEGVKPAEKELIKQQTIEQVANDMPMQYALQQAIQDVVPEEITSDSSSLVNGSSADIMDIINRL